MTRGRICANGNDEIDALAKAGLDLHPPLQHDLVVEMDHFVRRARITLRVAAAVLKLFPIRQLMRYHEEINTLMAAVLNSACRTTSRAV